MLLGNRLMHKAHKATETRKDALRTMSATQSKADPVSGSTLPAGEER
jgi:hypothetical protein